MQSDPNLFTDKPLPKPEPFVCRHPDCDGGSATGYCDDRCRPAAEPERTAPRWTYDTDAGLSKFDIQLGAALSNQDELAKRLAWARIELKTESYLWEKTGNICVEFENRGRVSGIGSTTADFWVHELRDADNRTVIYLMMPVPRLRQLCRVAYKAGRIVSGGDGNLSKMVLISISTIVSEMLACAGWPPVEKCSMCGKANAGWGVKGVWYCAEHVPSK